MPKTVNVKIAISGLGLAIAGGLAYLATRQVNGTPVPITKYVEERVGALQPHLATEADLGVNITPATVQHRYPSVVAPGLNLATAYGFAPLYQPLDPQIAAMPSEQAW